MDEKMARESCYSPSCAVTPPCSMFSKYCQSDIINREADASQNQSLKVPLRRKIVDPILSASEQHFQTTLNGVFSFSISCLVLEIFWFFETCKLGVSDVTYSRIINYIHKMVNISVNNRQNSFKLCMRIAIW